MKTDTILDEAKALIYGDRNAAYGHPRDDWSKTAMMITGLLLHKLKPGKEITAREGMLIMVLVKVSRESYRHARGNLVDMAGYPGCIERLDEQE